MLKWSCYNIELQKQIFKYKMYIYILNLYNIEEEDMNDNKMNELSKLILETLEIIDSIGNEEMEVK